MIVPMDLISLFLHKKDPNDTRNMFAVGYSVPSTVVQPNRGYSERGNMLTLNL